MYNIFGLSIGVPDYSSEVIEKNKNYRQGSLLLFHREVSGNHRYGRAWS